MFLPPPHPLSVLPSDDTDLNGLMARIHTMIELADTDKDGVISYSGQL